MNKSILTLIAIFFALAADAQGSLFINPYVGAGITNIKNSQFTGTQPTVSTTGTTAGIIVGRSLGRVSLSVGAALLNTANQTEFLVVITDNASPYGMDSGYVSYVYRHIVVPVKLGVDVLQRKFSIRPEVGIMPAYCLGQRAVFSSYNDGRTRDVLPSATYNRIYKRFTVFGTADINMLLRLNNKLALSICPTYNYMLTNILKPQPLIPGKRTQHHMAFTLNLGVTFSL